MDADLKSGTYIIVKGYIDAKDDKGHTAHGTILGVVSRREIRYLSVLFSGDETSRLLDWNDLLTLHRNRDKDGGRDPVAVHREEELFKYLQRGTILNTMAKNRSVKQAEQAISRYCADALQLKAVSLMEYFDASDSDLAVFDTEGGEPSNASTGAKKSDEPSGAQYDDEGNEMVPSGAEEPRAKDDLVVRCEPLLDPIRGVAMNELNIGEKVLAKLPADSVFFKLLSKNVSDFDGVVAAPVTGILMNELGTATISLNLSDGVSGVMKLSGKVRVKLASDASGEKPPRLFHARDIPDSVIFGAAGAVVVIGALAVLFYILR